MNLHLLLVDPAGHKHDKARNSFASHSKEVEFISQESTEDEVVMQSPMEEKKTSKNK